MREHVKVLQVMYMHASREPKWQAEAEALDTAIAALTRSEVPAGWGGDGLRLLVKELRESLEGVVRVADRQTDEFDRAREAIARAAHVFVNAGDSEAQFIADGENLDCPACGGSGHVDDSAPAGSGEVEEVLKKCDSVLNDMRPISPCLTEQMEEYFAEIRALIAELGQEVGDGLKDEDVEWIVNDLAELGVKIGSQFFFCYKGRSLIYEEATHDDDGRRMKWRPVFKREFGECVHPVNYEDLRKCGHQHFIGTVSLDDSGEWKDLPDAAMRQEGE